MTLVGHPLFAWIWTYWVPQPYENLAVRLLVSACGILLMLAYFSADPGTPRTKWLFGMVAWVQLPLFSSWMYSMNGGNAVWLASLVAQIVIYYHLTDWRLATLGTIMGILMGFGVADAMTPFPLASMPASHAIVFGYAWTAAVLLGLTSANLRRMQLSNTLATIGIMAHELRTPLSTAALISDSLQIHAEAAVNIDSAKRLAKLANRLRALTRNMNRHIDMQISNARLTSLPGDRELVSASDLVATVVDKFPYRFGRESECISVTVHQDFQFRASNAQFSQVLDNLIKNALHSLQTASSPYSKGDLRIEVDVFADKGRIVVTDCGVGIDPKMLPHIFEAFFSTNRGTGHGLGLAYCRRVVEAVGGTLKAKSVRFEGATFSIELPIHASNEIVSNRGAKE